MTSKSQLKRFAVQAPQRKIFVGYAQEQPDGKLLLMETNLDPDQIHDNGRPMYRLYREISDVRKEQHE